MHASTQSLLFEAGSRAYLDGDWQTAVDNWKRIEDGGYHNAPLYYNLGNAHYKLGKVGYAILYWERAASLAPEDDDIRVNLEVARSSLVDKLDERVRLPVWDWFDSRRAALGDGGLAWAASLACFLLFGSLAARRWLWRGRVGRIASKNLAWIVAIIMTLDLGLLALAARDDAVSRRGVLVAEAADVLSAPAEGTGRLLFTLHEGVKVRLLRELEDWYEIDADRDKRGWVKRSAVGEI